MGLTQPSRLTPRLATAEDIAYAVQAVALIDQAADAKFDIARRTVQELEPKFEKGHAVLLLDQKTLVGFGYFKPWTGVKLPGVSYSGIVTAPAVQGQGYGNEIVALLLMEGLRLFPQMTHFMLTTNTYMTKIAVLLNFKPGGLCDTTDDVGFWGGCRTCGSYDKFNAPPEPEQQHRTPLQQFCCCSALIYRGKDGKPDL